MKHGDSFPMCLAASEARRRHGFGETHSQNIFSWASTPASISDNLSFKRCTRLCLDNMHWFKYLVFLLTTLLYGTPSLLGKQKLELVRITRLLNKIALVLRLATTIAYFRCDDW